MTATLTKNVTINLDNVLPMLARAVEARGRDFVYLDHYAFCQYLKFDHDADLTSSDPEPACLIGHLIAQQGGKEALGLTGSQVAARLFGFNPMQGPYRDHGGGEAPQSFVREFIRQAGSSVGTDLPGFIVTAEAAAVLVVAQGLQDQNYPKRSWGEAYDAAVLAHDELVLIREAKALAAKAADEIEKRGWADHVLSDSRGCVCAVGGTGAAYFGHPRDGYETDGRYSALLTEVANGLNLEREGRWGSYSETERIYRWNDDVVAFQDNPQAYVVGKLREYAGVTA